MRAFAIFWLSPEARTPVIFCACWPTENISASNRSATLTRKAKAASPTLCHSAEHFSDGDKICVILGDNIIQGSIRDAVDQFRRQARGARILLKKVPDAERFGVAEIAGNRIVNIEEKPKRPKSDFAVTGIYMFDATVFDKIRTLVPSGRGELEITDVNNAYIAERTMTFSFLDGWWTDAGTFDSLLRAGNLVAQSRQQAAAASSLLENAKA